MQLGVNALRLRGKRAGVGRYIEYLLRQWSLFSEPFEAVRAYVPGPLEDPFPVAGAVSLHPLPSDLPPALWEHAVLPLTKPRDDLFFCPGYIVPLLSRERPRVVSHLGSYEAIPQAFPFFQRLKARFLYQLSCRRAERVITPSESSKQDLMRFYQLPEERIRVIPLGVDDAFRPLAEPARLEERRRAYFPDGRPFILFVGKLTARRHIPELLRAFALLRATASPTPGLVIIGPDSTAQNVPRRAAELGISGSVLHRPYADHGELVEAYNAADLFIYPSTYEGFGIPVLEAMACGTPVVTLENSAFVEFASDVAHFAREATPGALQRAMEEALGSEEIRQRARREGPRRAESYRWRAIARRTLAVLAEVARARGAEPGGPRRS